MHLCTTGHVAGHVVEDAAGHGGIPRLEAAGLACKWSHRGGDEDEDTYPLGNNVYAAMEIALATVEFAS